MNRFKYIVRNLFYYRRTHLGIVLGATLSTAVLVGALVVGDSVRGSLHRLVDFRLGSVHHALVTGDRMVSADKSQRFTKPPVPVLQTKGLAIARGGEARVNRLRIYGIDERFDRIFNTDSLFAALSQNQMIINEHLANRLNVNVGDQLLIRLENLDYLPKDAPLATVDDRSRAIRMSIMAVVDDTQGGRFNLDPDQVAPMNVFMHFERLNQEMDLDNQANLFLFPSNETDTDRLKQELDKVWTPSDIGLDISELPGQNSVELSSQRIFIEPEVERVALHLPGAKPLLTYFVNSLSANGRSTPYSFVTAMPSPDNTGPWDENEIWINTWLARDLDAAVGDSLELVYYVMGPMRTLVEESRTFVINRIIPMNSTLLDRQLLPDFPGLADEENCRDWEPGIPVDLDRIREKDEVYWDEYRGTPKALIGLEAGREMWANRFGELTAVRFKESPEKIAQHLKANLTPGMLGLQLLNVRQQGERASSQSVDFAGLFLGLSFFIIIAALLLTALLFVLNVEQRQQETGLLLAIGFTRKQIQRMLLSEGAVLALFGTFLGVLGGIIYNQLVLMALKSIWRGAVGTSALTLVLERGTLALGAGIGFLVALLSMVIALRKQATRPVTELQRGTSAVIPRTVKWQNLSFAVALVLLFTAVAIVILTSAGQTKQAAVAFFAGGTLLLVAGIVFLYGMLLRSLSHHPGRLSLNRLAWLSAARKRGRTLALVALLASALFIVFTVGANRQSMSANEQERHSGTGGFALFAETSLPILYDLDSQEGREVYSLEPLDSVDFVQLKLRPGTDASCLNLHRVNTPHLLGVDPLELNKRQAFTFTSLTKATDPDKPWLSLQEELAPDVVPGIADETVIVWGLGKSVGDSIQYIDEQGDEFYVKLVAGLAPSIMQGHVMISRQHFIQRYPSMSGSHIMLIDAPFDKLDSVQNHLAWALQDEGAQISRSSVRLAGFNQVTNTYLSIFLLLGGLGMMLGVAGIAIVVFRNVMERREELAVMRALGWTPERLDKLVVHEHVWLLSLGLFLGAGSALVAVLPALLTPGTSIPVLTIIVIFSVVLFSGWVWTRISTKLAMRSEILSVLQKR